MHSALFPKTLHIVSLGFWGATPPADSWANLWPAASPAIASQLSGRISGSSAPSSGLETSSGDMPLCSGCSSSVSLLSASCVACEGPCTPQAPL